MNAVQLNPTLPVDVKDYGTGEAVVMLDYGPDKDLYWVVFLDKDGQSIVVKNSSLRKTN